VPTTMPHVPPEKRPSVMRPTDSPSPARSARTSAPASPASRDRPSGLRSGSRSRRRLDLARHDRVHHLVLRVEHPRRSGDRRILEAR
jgi:hypothetical protein